MIIVEGPDGAGKSTLIARLSAGLSLPVHERAVKDRTGPDERDLWGWTCQDVLTWDVQPLSLYDRHPMISEYIYGPVVRGSLTAGFLHPSSRGILRRVHDRALVVFCLPDLHTVRTNVADEGVDQMAGVALNVDALYFSYASCRTNWGGWAVDYDYTSPAGKGSYESVVRSARLHALQWNGHS